MSVINLRKEYLFFYKIFCIQDPIAKARIVIWNLQKGNFKKIKNKLGVEIYKQKLRNKTT